MTVLDSATLTRNYMAGEASLVKIAILSISNVQESMTWERRSNVPDTSRHKPTVPHGPTSQDNSVARKSLRSGRYIVVMRKAQS